jgi:thiosulfate/3-mercaptopyruvate sulfurtransferase
MAENTIRYHDPEALVQTDWLEAHRGDANLRIFDCTTHLLPAEADTGAPYRIVSGKAEYDAAHIPGAGFVDLQGELSDNTTKLRFMLPSAEQFAAVMSRCGVGEGTRVVLYSADGIMWATRVWWVLRAFGFDNAAVLDGGWEKWQAEDVRFPRRHAAIRPRILLRDRGPNCSRARSRCGRRSQIPAP